jgi:hypothetical protein
MNEYFAAPKLCSYNGGGAFDFVCDCIGFTRSHRCICLYRKTWKPITYDFKCPNKEWQLMRKQSISGQEE